MHKRFYDKNFRLGILGGGQLGRMLIQSAINLDIKIKTLDKNSQMPASAWSFETMDGNFNKDEDVLCFAEGCDVLTIEIENVATKALLELEKSGKAIYPQPAIIEIIQDKIKQKQFYKKHGLPSSKSFVLKTKADIESVPDDLFPAFIKLAQGGYDGRGVFEVVSNKDELFNKLNYPLLLEEKVKIEREISVIAARNTSGDIQCFPPVAMEFNSEANLVEFIYQPSGLTQAQEEKAISLARKVAHKFGIVGILAVEMFLDKEGNILINECAPRPHNSGHISIEATTISQYDQHLRCILGLPLVKPEIKSHAIMLNILGDPETKVGPVIYDGLEDLLAQEQTYVHLYGKDIVKPFRKMGHITLCGNNVSELRSKAKKILNNIKAYSHA